jgi:hypothetical protein
MLPEPKLVGVGPMARRIKVAVKWLREEALAGRVPHLDAGGKLLFNPRAVIDALAARAGAKNPAETVARAESTRPPDPSTAPAASERRSLYLLTAREVDRMLCYPRGRSVKLAKAGKIPHVLLPDGEVRFDADALRDFLRGCAGGPSPVPEPAAGAPAEAEEAAHA